LGFISASLLQGFEYQSVISLQYCTILSAHNTFKIKYLKLFQGRLNNVEVASPAGLTCWDDLIHFTSESQRTYGFRYAAKMMEMVGTRTTTADVNGDGDVDLFDLGLISEKWLSPVRISNIRDINNDGEVNVYDFIIMGQQWGQ